MHSMNWFQACQRGYGVQLSTAAAAGIDKATMEDTAQTKAATGHALVAGSAGGGDTGSGFGLGVGFALSPELAQKVRPRLKYISMFACFSEPKVFVESDHACRLSHPMECLITMWGEGA